MGKILAVITGTTLLTWGATSAQEPTSRQPGSQQQPSAPQERTRPDMNVQQKAADAVLITWLLVESENEVELARIAEQRATMPEVKQFAQKMIDEHGQMVQKLQRANTPARTDKKGTRDAPSEPPITGGDPNRNDPNRAEPTRPDTNRTDPNRRVDATDRQPMDASGVRDAAGALDPQKVIRDLGKKHLQSATKMLQEKQGADFDRCYMDMQLGAQVKAVDMIQVFRNHASDGLRPTLEEGLEMVQAHLQNAKDLAKRTEERAAVNLRR